MSATNGNTRNGSTMNGNAMNGSATHAHVQDDDEYNEKYTPEEQQRRRNRWVTALETFSPVWFAVVMNTGILSITMHNLPYQFSALGILSTIMFVFGLVLFVLFSAIHIARLICFPRSAYRQTVADPEQACLWGCAVIALHTLTAQVALTASSAKWGGHALSMVAYVMWWFGTACMITCAMVVYISLIRLQHGKDMAITTAIFIPAVGTVTDALTGALVTNYAVDLSARLSVPIIITGYMLLGFGAFVALIVYAIFLFCMLNKTMYLPYAKYPGLLLLVGPMGQSSGAIQLLGSAASKSFGNYHKGIFLTEQASTVVSSAGTMIGLMFAGFDIFWLLFALYFIMDATLRGKMVFTMTWWSSIFPTATLMVAFLALSIDLDSPTFRVLTTGMFLILLLDYFLCWAFTFRDIWRGKILDGREQLVQIAKKGS